MSDLIGHPPTTTGRTAAQRSQDLRMAQKLLGLGVALHEADKPIRKNEAYHKLAGFCEALSILYGWTPFKYEMAVQSALTDSLPIPGRMTRARSEWYERTTEVLEVGLRR